MMITPPEMNGIIMANINRDIIFFMEKNVRGAWVIYGQLGVRQYYGFTKSEARKRYIADSNIFVNEK